MATVEVQNWGGYTCQFQIRGPNGRTGMSSTKNVGAGAVWTYQELYDAGFKDGDSCWASVDVDGGRQNHESGDNFTLDGKSHLYQCRGTIWFPDFSLNY